MTERFKEIFKHTLKWEGGDKLHNVAGDRGAATKYGISYNFNKHKFKTYNDFVNMTFETAAKIAYDDYYMPVRAYLANPEAEAMLFDIAFNMGVKTAVKLAQRALKIKDDGIIGDVTKEALKRLNKLKLYDERAKYYSRIILNDPTQNKFFKGWNNRNDYFLKTNI